MIPKPFWLKRLASSLWKFWQSSTPFEDRVTTYMRVSMLLFLFLAFQNIPIESLKEDMRGFVLNLLLDDYQPAEEKELFNVQSLPVAPPDFSDVEPKTDYNKPAVKLSHDIFVHSVSSHPRRSEVLRILGLSEAEFRNLAK